MRFYQKTGSSACFGPRRALIPVGTLRILGPGPGADAWGPLKTGTPALCPRDPSEVTLDLAAWGLGGLDLTRVWLLAWGPPHCGRERTGRGLASPLGAGGGAPASGPRSDPEASGALSCPGGNMCRPRPPLSTRSGREAARSARTPTASGARHVRPDPRWWHTPATVPPSPVTLCGHRAIAGAARPWGPVWSGPLPGGGPGKSGEARGQTPGGTARKTPSPAATRRQASTGRPMPCCSFPG